MKPLGILAAWQRLAGFDDLASKRFLDGSEKCKFVDEAHPSNKRSVSVCQNRYPSPSRWSDQNFLVRPSWFWQIAAASTQTIAIVIAYQRDFSMISVTGVFSRIRSKRLIPCVNQLHLPLSWHSRDWLPATGSTRTWSVLRWEQLPAASLAKSSSTDDASRVPSLAVLRALSRTTSENGAVTFRKVAAINTWTKTAETLRQAAFVIAYQRIPTLLCTKGMTLNKIDRGRVTCRNTYHLPSSRHSSGLVPARKGQTSSVRRSAASQGVWSGTSSKRASALPARLSEQQAARWSTTSEFKAERFRRATVAYDHSGPCYLGRSPTCAASDNTPRLLARNHHILSRHKHAGPTGPRPTPFVDRRPSLRNIVHV